MFLYPSFRLLCFPHVDTLPVTTNIGDKEENYNAHTTLEGMLRIGKTPTL